MAMGILALLTLLTACPRAAERAGERMAERMIERGTGADVDVSAGKDAVKITHEESGTETTIQRAGGMPEGWPAELPQYPGSTIEGSTTQSTEVGTVYHVMLKAAASPDEVAAFYREKATAAGYAMKNEATTPEGKMLMLEKAEWMFMVRAAAADGGCQINLQLLPKGK